MKTLKDLILKSKKDEIYPFYVLIKPDIPISKITKLKMYEDILASFKNDPEIILKMCGTEQIGLLKKLLEADIPLKNYGYIEYILLSELCANYLVILDDNKYYIPQDIYNYVKMALNLFNDQEENLRDFYETTIIGLIRTYATVEINDFQELLNKYGISIKPEDLINDIKNKYRLKKLVDVVKYKKKTYVISKEYMVYKDVLTFREKSQVYDYTIESILSIGKYRIDMFNRELLQFLHFLELYLEPYSIENLLEDMVIYAGFSLNNSNTLKALANNIEKLYTEMAKVIKYFPSWITPAPEANPPKPSSKWWHKKNK